MFDKIKGPIFLKDDSEAENQLLALKELYEKAEGKLANEIDMEIRRVEAGIYGEKTVRFELENSHIPMFVIHDLFLEHEGLTAQIDYLIITRKRNYVVECKNLFGNIEINSAGDFIRTMSYGRNTKKEGIYSPVTQNARHMELIKKIRSAERKNVFTKALSEKNFSENYKSIIVLANPKTVLNARYAKKEIRNQVIRADQLVSYIKKTDSARESITWSEKEIEELASFFLGIHQEPKVDYTAKYREALEAQTLAAEEEKAQELSETVVEKASDSAEVICPRCGASMVLRKAKRGDNAGIEFYGCSTFPKCRGIVQL